METSKYHGSMHMETNISYISLSIEKRNEDGVEVKIQWDC